MHASIVKLMVGSVALGFFSGCATGPMSPDYDKNAARKAVTVTQSSRGAVITSDERVLFDSGKSDVSKNGEVFVNRVASVLNGKTTANVLIEGHTDNVGGAAFNKQLSERRANAVMQALVSKGVKKDRITTRGMGMNNPVADNATAEGRQANRRTEIIVLGESAEKIGGASLADSLSEGLDRFLKSAGDFINNAFGSAK